MSHLIHTKLWEIKTKNPSHNGGKLSYLTHSFSFFSFGGKLKTIDKKFSPSPGAYEINQHCVGKGQASKWGFGTEARK